MGRFIIRLHDHYLEWSTIVDAPVTWGMSLDEFKDYYREEYGNHGYRDLDDRLQRVEAKGTSAHNDNSAEDTMNFNRAGPNESALTFEEVYRAYCLREPVKGWRMDDTGKWEKVME